MKQVTQIPKEGLLSYLKEILLPYDLSGDTRSRLISSARHLLAFMEKRHLDFYNEDVGNFFTSTITLEKGVGARHYQRDCRMVKLLNSSMKGEVSSLLSLRPSCTYQFTGDFGYYAQQYLTSDVLREKMLASQTIDTYKLYISRFCGVMEHQGVTSAIGNLRQIDMYIASNPPQGSIDQSYYEGWLDSVRVPEASTKAVYSKAATFRQFLKFLKALGVNDFIPRLPRCKDNFFVPYIYSHEEIQAIFQAIDSTVIRSEFNRTSLMSMPVLFKLLYSTGMRVGEAVSICNKDVDFQHHVILIEESKNRHQRICPINKSLQEVIQGYIRYRNMLPMKKVSLPDSPLLVNRCGHSLNINTVERWFRESLRKAGIPYRGHFAGPRIHDLRHTACVHAMIKLVREGMDLYCSLPVLSKFLGHLDAYSTERYLRLTQEVYPDIINKVNLSLPEIKAIVERISKTEHWHEDN